MDKGFPSSLSHCRYRDVAQLSGGELRMEEKGLQEWWKSFRRSSSSDLAGTPPVALTVQAWVRTDQERPKSCPLAPPAFIRQCTLG